MSITFAEAVCLYSCIVLKVTLELQLFLRLEVERKDKSTVCIFDNMATESVPCDAITRGPESQEASFCLNIFL